MGRMATYRTATAIGALALLCALSPAPTQAVAQTAPPAQQRTGIATTSPLWVKLCSDVSVPNAAAAAEPATKQVCLMAHHERLDRQTGMVLVSVAIRKLADFDKQLLAVMVPLGMAIKPGIILKFDNETEGTQLDYTACHFAGCTAETIATDELVAKMKSGKQMTVTAVNQTGRQLLFPVPLDGFTKAYDGPAQDMNQYSEERRDLIKRLREPLYSQERNAAQRNMAQ